MGKPDIDSQAVLEKLLLENLIETRRKRRWGVFFKLAFFVLVAGVLIAWFKTDLSVMTKRSKPHTAVIDISGAIMPGTLNDADHVVSSLTKAFNDPGSKGIIIRIDSPGGSPVQAAYIYDNIMRLRKKHPDVKIYAVCSDLCASAAYYVASATSDIYADPSSLVGSIGVLLNGFGFVDIMKKTGVSRRLIIAGSEKGFLDPFSEMTPQDKAHAQKMVDIVHQQFIKAVEQGRGDRLDTKDPMIFSGLVWTGEQAKTLGLIDGFGSAGYVARNIIKAPVTVNYSSKRNVWDKLGKGFGSSFANGVLSAFLGTRLQ